MVEVTGLPSDVSFDDMIVVDGELVLSERGPTSDPSFSLVFYQVESGQVRRNQEWQVGGVVYHMDASADGSRLAASVLDSQGMEPHEEFLKVWKISDGTELFSRVLPAGQDGRSLRDLAISADGSRAAYCPIPTGRAIVWEIDEERKDVVSAGGTEVDVCFLDYSPDGKWLAINTTGTNLYTGNDLSPSVTISNNHYNTGSVLFSADSRTMAIGAGECIRLWDVTDIK